MNREHIGKAVGSGGHYDANYDNFDNRIYGEIRREAFGEDIGQNSWLTASELDGFSQWLQLSPGKKLLDVACGAGGPALRLAATSGCSVVGIDVHEQAIENAKLTARERELTHRAEFQLFDATSRLPFSDASFDAITCIDAINHFSDRSSSLLDWRRILKPAGRILFTDPLIITGPISKSEIAARTSAGFYLLVPPRYDQQILEQCGLRLIIATDVTENMANVAARRRLAREARAGALRPIEGNEAYETQQQFLHVAATLAKERRLSRFVFVAER